jgi:hypothetical protein
VLKLKEEVSKEPRVVIETIKGMISINITLGY